MVLQPQEPKLESIPYTQLNETLFSLEGVTGELGRLPEVRCLLISDEAGRVSIVEDVVHFEVALDAAPFLEVEHFGEPHIGLERVSANPGVLCSDSDGKIVVHSVTIEVDAGNDVVMQWGREPVDRRELEVQRQSPDGADHEGMA